MSSQSSEVPMSVERDGVVPLPRRPTAVVTEPAPAPAAPIPQPVAVAPPAQADRAFVGVLSALAALLAARLLLLLSIAGAFVLALLTVRAESYLGLAVLSAFCALTVIPMTYLDVVTHRRGGR